MAQVIGGKPCRHTGMVALMALPAFAHTWWKTSAILLYITRILPTYYRYLVDFSFKVFEQLFSPLIYQNFCFFGPYLRLRMINRTMSSRPWSTANSICKYKSTCMGNFQTLQVTQRKDHKKDDSKCCRRQIEMHQHWVCFSVSFKNSKTADLLEIPVG